MLTGHLLDMCLQIHWMNQQYSRHTILVEIPLKLLWIRNVHYQCIRQQRDGDLQ